MRNGSARPTAGRPADPNALRRDRRDDAPWTNLPAAGRQGDAPSWPLELLSPRESQLWESLWAKPVAILWERDQQFEYVALYVRTFVEAEERGALAAYRTLVRSMSTDLLLTVPAMNAARVRIAEITTTGEEPEPQPRRKSSSRDRMRVVALPTDREAAE